MLAGVVFRQQPLQCRHEKDSRPRLRGAPCQEPMGRASSCCSAELAGVCGESEFLMRRSAATLPSCSVVGSASTRFHGGPAKCNGMICGPSSGYPLPDSPTPDSKMSIPL